jgi:tetratricopeptide (TPR) repeat protein
MSPRIVSCCLLAGLLFGCASAPAWMVEHDRARTQRLCGDLKAALGSAQRALERVPPAADCRRLQLRVLRAELRSDLGHPLEAAAAVEPVRAALEAGVCDRTALQAWLRARLLGLALAAGRFETARRLHDRALAAVEAGLEPGPAAAILTELAVLPLLEADMAAAGRLLERAAELWPRAQRADRLTRLLSRLRLARVRVDSGAVEEAEALLAAGLDRLQQLGGPLHPYRIGGLLTRTRLALRRQDLSAAESTLDTTRRVAAALDDPKHPLLLELRLVEAEWLAARGDAAGARVVLRRVVDDMRHRFGVEHPYVAVAAFQLAALLHAHNRPAAAEPLLRTALKRWRTAAGRDSPAAVKIELALAAVHLQAGQPLRAEMLCRDVLERIDRVAVADSDRRAVFELLGRACSAQHKLLEAWRAYVRLVRLLREQQPDQPGLELAAALEGLAGVAGAAGQPDQAMGPLQRALAIRRQHLGEQHREVGRTLIKLSGMHFMAGRLRRAEDLLGQGLAVLEAELGALHPLLVEPLEALARVRLRDGRPRAAVAPLERALDILRAAGVRGDRRQRLQRILRRAREAD